MKHSHPERTQPVDWVGKKFDGYMTQAEFSAVNARKVHSLVDDIQTKFGDAVFCMPEPSLHITLLDWIAPLVDYGGQDKQALFEQVRPVYDRVLSEAIAAHGPITVHFDEIRVAPTTIFVVGHDQGQFQHIREHFLRHVTLLAGTKLPPTIIHTSLARFTRAIDLVGVQDFMATKSVDVTQKVTSFRLVHSSREPLLEFEILKRYKTSAHS